jgi:uncharacterized protein YycO
MSLLKVAFLKRDPSLMGWLIQTWTRSPYIHTELVFNDVTMVSSIQGIGVRSLHVPGWYDRDKWDTIEVVVSESEQKAILEWLKCEMGSGYDWFGLFMCQVFRFGRHNQNKWFCSELCTAALQSIGRFPGVKPYQQSPAKLYKLLRSYGYA